MRLHRARRRLQAMFACESQTDLEQKLCQLKIRSDRGFRRMNLMHDGDAAPLGEW